MNCHDMSPLVALYCDGELDPTRCLELEKHLLGCARCASERDALLALRKQLKSNSLYFTTLPGQRQKILQATVAKASPASALRPPRRWAWAATGAAAGSAATVLAWLTASAVLQTLDRDALPVEAVRNHVRATMGEHLIAIASSDQHTVKPWLSARLDFSPPVKDFTAAGYPLVGARLDTLGGQPVAALVYRYREHTIDVFVRPVAGTSASPQTATIRGFNVAHIRAGGMDWWSVSDVNASALRTLMDDIAHVD